MDLHRNDTLFLTIASFKKEEINAVVVYTWCEDSECSDMAITCNEAFDKDCFFLVFFNVYSFNLCWFSFSLHTHHCHNITHQRVTQTRPPPAAAEEEVQLSSKLTPHLQIKIYLGSSFEKQTFIAQPLDSGENTGNVECCCKAYCGSLTGANVVWAYMSRKVSLPRLCSCVKSLLFC